MTITVNGEPKIVPDSATVADVLASCGVNPLLVAVEVNLDILRREQYAGAVLRAGDTVEIVQMVGGGSGG
ncbi:MAG: sulfur carrier protein ThiS [Candidatus Omnitrophica bacterium]|nr:sulfur carrier protein ThiS [Candidatus Omnitrophota bacterium]